MKIQIPNITQKISVLIDQVINRFLSAEHAAIRTFRAKRADFYEDFALRISDKGAISQILTESITNERKYGSKLMADALVMLLDRYIHASGTDCQFSEAIKGLVPESERMIMFANEKKGDLHVGLTFLAKSVRDTEELKAISKEVATSPALTFITQIVTLYIYAEYLIPQYTANIPKDKWGSFMELMDSFAWFVLNVGPFLMVALIAAVTGLIYALPRWTGPNRRYFDDRIFPMYRNREGAFFLLSLTALENAGTDRGTALQLISANATPFIRSHCQKIIQRRSQHTNSEGLAFDTGIFPRDVTARVIHLASLSTAREQFQNIGNSVMEQTTKRLARKSKQIGQYAELIAGALTTLIAVAMIYLAYIVENISS